MVAIPDLQNMTLPMSLENAFLEVDPAKPETVTLTMDIPVADILELLMKVGEQDAEAVPAAPAVQEEAPLVRQFGASRLRAKRVREEVEEAPVKVLKTGTFSRLRKVAA